jgi:hypothetical protein
MNKNGEQAELFGLIWRPYHYPFRLRVNDIVRINEKLGRVIRINECAAVVLINQSARQFTTRFDKPVHFQPPPVTVRISVNSETEILNRKAPEKRKPRGKHVRTNL